MGHATCSVAKTIAKNIIAKKCEENLVPQLKSSGMWNDTNLGWLLQNAESLLLKETNNPAEPYVRITVILFQILQME